MWPFLLLRFNVFMMSMRANIMSGKKSFSSLRDRMSSGSKARSAEKAAALRVEMDLSEIRRARKLSQE